MTYNNTIRDKHNSNYNNYYSADLSKVLQRIAKKYEECLNQLPNAFVMKSISLMIRNGCTPSLIERILEYTAEMAPRPSWMYAKTVLSRKLAEGITTAEGFDESCIAFRQKREPMQYEQREYNPADFGLSAEDIAEAKRL